MPAPPEISALVERFERGKEAYTSGEYNETQLRREFLDPFFTALGWDVENKKGYAEAYKDVVHEDSIKIGTATKAPDYSFRIGGIRKFFFEAKKPSVDLREDPGPAYQLRRYAWSAKLPLSILTDFEELAIYDCRIKPRPSDKPSVGRVLFFKYTEYVEKWDEIAAIFSRESILKGSFDKYVESTKGKRGTAEVDDAFLEEIEAWRELLAKDIASNNPKLSVRDLNFAVQRTIDRIIFLRICEDRGIETYGTLLGLTSGPRIYKRLCELFYRADEKYNSGLFHFQKERGRTEPPDEFTPGLEIDDKSLKEIIKGLYYPDSSYEFSVLPADILGQVYEQFLGKVIRLTAGHQAKIEEKPEVKKAGGVYYTPTYIVDYIVKNTVGKILEELSEKEKDKKILKSVSKLRVLDPACGSGSFLIGAYQYLLDWHRDWYVKDGTEKWATGKNPTLYQGQGGDWRLTAAERKRILLNNIYGVDIDPQAVEVTKLSLLLKVLEGENEQTISKQLKIFHERALPDLVNNIKCGNSLIGPDFYDGQQLSLMDDEERIKINAFDWKTEFKEIMDAGGFDAVIGNPPYVLLQDDFRDEGQLRYFRKWFSAASYKIDTYHLFMERGILLTRNGGLASMITPANFLTNNNLTPLRRFILEETRIDHIVIIQSGVFRRISVDNAIFVVNRFVGKTTEFHIVHATASSAGLFELRRARFRPEKILEDKYLLFTGSQSKLDMAFLDQLCDMCWKLGDIAHVNFGKQLRDRKKFDQDVIKVKDLRAIPNTHVPCYTGKDVTRYSLRWGNLACLDNEIARSGGCWDPDKHRAVNKIVTRQIGRYPEFAIDLKGWDCLNTMFMINITMDAIDPYYVLGVLNSKLIQYFWLNRFYDQRRTFPKIKGTYLKDLPIAKIRSDTRAQECHDKIVSNVRNILELAGRLDSAKTTHDKAVLARDIEAMERHINELVYELYGLTEEERRIVEGS